MKEVSKIKKLLIQKNAVISCAESCTGGLINSYLTDISGASNFLKEGFVTYSEQAKIKHLGVLNNTIKKCGVVSYEVAIEMAKGLVKNSDYALSTTGILGPNTDEFNTPIGTVFIGLGNKKIQKCIKYQSNKKTRIAIKKDIAKTAISYMADFIEKN